MKYFSTTFIFLATYYFYDTSKMWSWGQDKDLKILENFKKMLLKFSWLEKKMSENLRHVPP